ncbi:copper homeostasis protein CutC [Psychromonas ossibalaenae]|uniref:copper homeostasis protein CutC n=1 Tax=Psychromonas ossibalaenae TaxID=444922 RepID=UPI00037A432C|nr:copper homeostasis protein CutC [Psychromonas ossibalaenae]
MINVEVCIDNIESLFTAQKSGAGRIELCSSLALGGLTPSSGLIELAVKHASVPVYTMIRPRDGDFLYSSFEVEMMLKEIHSARSLGAQGVVFGVLNEDAQIDKDILKSLMRESAGLGVTFHRAIDCCRDVHSAVEAVMSAGCERILTSGLADNAYDGRAVINQMVKQSAGRLSVMAGAGINSDNVGMIIKESGICEVHLSGKKLRASHMKKITACGKLPEFLSINVTDADNIDMLKSAVNPF